MNIEKLKAQHAKELADAEKAERIAEVLPLDATQICIHSDYASVSFGKNYPERYSFREALAIFDRFADDVVIAEGWRNGCLSVQPAEINSYARKERSTHDFSSFVELRLEAGQGHDSHQLQAFVKLGGHMLKISIEISPEWKWLPDAGWTNRDVERRQWRVVPKGIGEDKFVRWYNSEGNYHLSYFWESKENFDKFAEVGAVK